MTPDGDGTANGGRSRQELNLEDYFRRMDDIFERSDRQLDDLSSGLTEAIDARTTVEDGVSRLDEYLTETRRVISTAIDEMEAFEEPSETSVQHAAFISAIRDARGKLDAL